MKPKPTSQHSPPVADRREEAIERHGRIIVDPYAWLRDSDWQQVMRQPKTLRQDIRGYLEEENAHTSRVLSPITNLRNLLMEELKARIKEDDSSVPSPDGPWCYYQRFVTGGQYPTLCRRHRDSNKSSDAGADEQILLDGNKEAEEEKFFSIHGTAHTKDHTRFAYAVDYNGSEYCSVRFKDLETDTVLEDVLQNAQGDIEWSADGTWLFYTVLDDNHRPSKVLRHKIGTPTHEDVLVCEELDPAYFLRIHKTESGRFIIINAHDHADTSEVRLVDTDNPNTPPILIAPRNTGVTYEVSDHGEKFLIRTNSESAVDFKIAETTLSHPNPANWNDLVAYKPGRLIRAMLLFEDYLVRLEREHALPRIVIRSLLDGNEHVISFEEEAYELGLMRGYEYSTTTLRFSYSSPTTPQRIFDYDMVTRERILQKEQAVPSGHDPSDYICRRLMAPSHDGMNIPITVLHAKDTPIDRTAPMLLYGYGSYGYAMPAGFSSHVFSLLDRGFVYAIAHVRGGTENGYHWYLDGKLNSKKNTFLDFICVAEHLIANKYTIAGKIVAQGRSAGGMLMGAVANMRPDLFIGILGEVPFVDVINTMCDETLPLTPPEWVEWGNPIKNANAFHNMASYCPYTNITDQPYPNVLSTGGLTDPRVTYWEPAKWVAKLRHHNTGDSQILLWINMEAGHGGASGRYDRLKEIALSYGFALMILGKVKP